MANVDSPNVFQPQKPGDLVGFNLQNASSAGVPARILSFGQAFLPGQFKAGAYLVAVIDGAATPVQVDVRNRFGDGSVSFAQITLRQPALASGATVGAMLAIAPVGQAPAPTVDLAAALGQHSLSVDLELQSGESGIPAHIDLANAMRTALESGTASWWQKGPLASQARVTVPVSGSLYVQADITAFADGNFKADVHLNNDLAMSPTGGTVTYDATVTLDGKAVVQPGLVQFQYQNWNKVMETGPAVLVNVQHDLNHLERTGLVANFDPDRAGYFSDESAGMSSRMAGAAWNAPFAANDIAQYMPMAGGRPDIGPTTGANARWLLTQDAAAAEYALDQAGAADGIPWHFKDVATGTWLNTSNHPNLWVDPRGAPDTLTQPVDERNNGWTPENAHQPDTSYVPYILTGERAFLDEANAQASFAIMNVWPERRAGQALVARYMETRADAWNLRQVQEAARINPDGTPEKTYYSHVADVNWKWLVSMIPAWTEEQGEAYGYIGNVPSMYPGLYFAAWQNDYVATTTAAAASQGNEAAKTLLKFQAHWLSGRFLNADKGFDPHNGVTYFVSPGDVQASGIRTWAGMQAATVAAGQDNGGNWPGTDYTELAMAALAGVVTNLGDTQEGYDAMKAYGMLASSGAYGLTVEPQFQIAPRLADGRLLTWSNIIVSHSAAGTTNTVEGPNPSANQLLHAGDGDDTLIGGTGVNLLFAGAGRNTLVGNAGADYLFGGTGAATFQGGAGTNYMDAGKGAATFVLQAADTAQDRIANFKPGTDLLQVTTAAGSAATTDDVDAMIGRATQDADGNAVLRLSEGHTVTLVSISTSQLTPAVFGHPVRAEPTAVTAKLGNDTGASSTDGVTRDAGLTGTGEANATVTVRNGATTLATARADASGHWSVSGSALGLADGSYALTASQADRAGNTASANVGLTLDTKSPAVTAKLGNDTGVSPTDAYTNNPVLAGTAEAGALLLSVDGGAAVSVAADAAGRWNHTPVGLADGTHVVTVSQTDQAGNTGTAKIGFTLDTKAPAVTAKLGNDTGASSTDGVTRDAGLTGTGEANATVTVRNGATTLATARADASGHWSVSGSALGLADGSYALTASQADRAGNTASANVGLTLDTKSPVPVIARAVANWNGTMTFTGTSEAKSKITLSDTIGPTTPVGTATASASGDWSVTATINTATAHSYTAKAADVAGNNGSTAGKFVVSGSGRDTLVGTNRQSDVFAFPRPFGKDVINGFEAASIAGANHDYIDLSQSGYTSYTQLKSHIEQGASGAVIAIDARNAITLAGVATKSLGANDFRFGDNSAKVAETAPVPDPTLVSGQVLSILAAGTDGVRFIDAGGHVALSPDDVGAGAARLYRAALGRAPDEGGLQFWVGRLRDGASLDDLSKGFLNSPEFAGRFGAPDDAGFVAELYQNVLGRQGEASGRAYWTDRLAQGAGREAVLIGFSESAENRQATQSLFSPTGYQGLSAIGVPGAA